MLSPEELAGAGGVIKDRYRRRISQMANRPERSDQAGKDGDAGGCCRNQNRFIPRRFGTEENTGPGRDDIAARCQAAAIAPLRTAGRKPRRFQSVRGEDRHRRLARASGG